MAHAPRIPVVALLAALVMLQPACQGKPAETPPESAAHLTEAPPEPAAKPPAIRQAAAPVDPAALERAVLAEVNRVRRERKLAPLQASDALTRAARDHSRQMAKSGTFSHDGADGSSPTDRAALAGFACARKVSDTRAQGLAENLYMLTAYKSGSVSAKGGKPTTSYQWYSADEAARAIVKGWLNSPGHRANLLDPIRRQTGVGVGYSPGDRMLYVTQEYC